MPIPALLCALLAQSSTLPWHWQPLASGSTASLRGLDVVDARTAWASGAGGTVLRTRDGQRWERLVVPGAEELDFRDVQAFDADTALVVSAGQPARVYRTEDGGARWTLTLEHADERAFFDACDFWDHERGLLFSDPIEGRLEVFATADGGRTWARLSRERFPASPAGEAGFAASGTCLAVSGAADGWIALGGLSGARVFRTADGGASWSVADTSLTRGAAGRGVFSLAPLGAGRLVAVGGDYEVPDQRAGSAAWSADGGATWRAPASTPRGYRSGVAALDATTLVAVGPGGTDVSFDGGASWRSAGDQGFHAVAAGPDGSVFAAGANGRLARLVRGGATARWDRFRGPNGTGLAAGTGYPTRVGPAEHVRWKRPFPPGHSSPVLSADALFLTALDGERLVTVAVDRADGHTLWERELPRSRRTTFHPKNHAAAASAAVDADTVVVFFDEFGLAAYDHAGAERWRLPLGPFDNVYGMGASPLLVDDVVVLACDQGTDSFVLGVGKDDGVVRWRTPRPRAISGHCTPVVRASADGVQEVLLPGSFLLDAYDAATGARRWWVRGLPAEMKSVPVLLGDTLWLHGYASPLNDPGNQVDPGALADMDADGDGGVTAAEVTLEPLRPYFPFFDLDQDGVLDAPEWEVLRDNLAAVNAAMAITVGGAGDLTGSAVRWTYHRSIPQLPSPLVVGDTYYLVADQGGLVTTLAPETGELRERGRLLDAADAYYASPVAADGKVWLLSEAGLLTVLPQGGSLAPLLTVDLGEPCYATPALEDGRLWLRTEGTLYCFGF